MNRLLVPFLLATLALPALAQEDSGPPATQAELKALSEEVRRLKLELSVPDVVQFGSYSGMGMGASKVHFQPKGLSIGGYGEFVYTNYADDRADFAEVLRLVLYVGYRFNEMIVFNSEIEFEHGAREIGIEMAYFDFMLARRAQAPGRQRARPGRLPEREPRAHLLLRCLPAAGGPLRHPHHLEPERRRASTATSDRSATRPIS